MAEQGFDPGCIRLGERWRRRRLGVIDLLGIRCSFVNMGDCFAKRHGHVRVGSEQRNRQNGRAMPKPNLLGAQRPADDETLDIARALVNLADPRIPVDPLHWKLI